jgi:hypothetical protein
VYCTLSDNVLYGRIGGEVFGQDIRLEGYTAYQADTAAIL